jgi:hypothetical protein
MSLLARIVSLVIVISVLYFLFTVFYPAFSIHSADIHIGSNENDDTRPHLTLAFGEPDWFLYDDPYIPISIESVASPNTWVWKDGGCYTAVEIRSLKPKRNPRGSESDLRDIEPPMCFENSTNRTSSDPFSNYGLRNAYGVPNYYFPFDAVNLKILVNIKGAQYINGKSVAQDITPPLIAGHFQPSNWDVEMSQEQLDFGTSVNVIYRRPLIYRVVTIGLFAALALIIFVLPFIKDNGSFLEVLVGLIFGIWGIRQVLLPAFVTWTTILDPLTLALYMMLVVAIFTKFILLSFIVKVDQLSDRGNSPHTLHRVQRQNTQRRNRNL